MPWKKMPWKKMPIYLFNYNIIMSRKVYDYKLTSMQYYLVEEKSQE